jgi:hypothetical protein
MGLLDDAIKEHLELKRVRGADPGEVIRQEREALGTAVRHEEPAPESDDQRYESQGDSADPNVATVQDAWLEPDPGESSEAPSAPASDLATNSREWDRGDAESTRETVDRERPEIAQRTPEQDTAEVDMHAMLGLDDESEITAEAAHGYEPAEAAESGDPGDPGDAGESWGGPPSMRE